MWPVEAARALQMSTAVSVITALTHKLCHQERAKSDAPGEDISSVCLLVYLFVSAALTLFCALTNDRCSPPMT